MLKEHERLTNELVVRELENNLALIRFDLNKSRN